AVITHAHSDHARAGHRAVLATPETLALMRARMDAALDASTLEPLPYGEPCVIGGITLRLVPAGHVLGSAQVVLEGQGRRVVASGDYKRQPDPTCAPFRPVPCDLFVSEATFGLPVFHHPDPASEIARLLESLALFPRRPHLVGCYSLGKCQRLIAMLRAAGWDRPIYLHGAHASLCRAYEALGVALGDLRPLATKKEALSGAIVLAPPAAAGTPWARRLGDPVICLASGWMRVRQRAKARGVELPLVISDHADWDALLATCSASGAGEVWVTHGREEALIHALAKAGIHGRALSLVGYDEAGSGE
ncbi:MAG: ligase-associated DNA damage response exonuclease, partial [Acetobacteraceae bacterium]